MGNIFQLKSSLVSKELVTFDPNKAANVEVNLDDDWANKKVKHCLNQLVVAGAQTTGHYKYDCDVNIGGNTYDGCTVLIYIVKQDSVHFFLGKYSGYDMNAILSSMQQWAGPVLMTGINAIPLML